MIKLDKIYKINIIIFVFKFNMYLISLSFRASWKNVQGYIGIHKSIVFIYYIDYIDID